MGLNDLTLEKLIGEINSYKQRMQTLYEDYGRAAQDLQDRINVLGYNLNEQLKDVKDSISSTPQRLLTLETKYVSGEVNDQEYRVQRSEFKSLLQHNLHTIEDIKSMINVLSMIEARPLGPAEIRQATPNPTTSSSTPSVIPANLIPRAYGPTQPQAEDRNRPASFPEKPSYVAQLPAQQSTIASSNNPSPNRETSAEQIVSTFPFTEQLRNQRQEPSENWTPTPPSTLQQSQEAPQSATLPAPTSTSETPTQLTTLVPEAHVQDVSPKQDVTETATTTSIVESEIVHSEANTQLPTANPEITSPATLETHPTPDVPTSVGTLSERNLEGVTSSVPDSGEPISQQVDTGPITIDADDALTVKVVEELPGTLEGSAIMESSETQVQSPLIGGGVASEISSGVPAPNDIAQISPSQPSPFYKVVCPKCGADVPQPAKVWELKGGKSKKNVLIGLFQCQDCRVKFREALTREII